MVAATPLSRRGPDPSERLRRLLSLPADETSAQALLAAVDDVSLDVARQALRRLVPLAGPAEATTLRKRMLALDIGIVGDVATVLRELGDRGAVEVAVAGLAAESWFDRQKAALALRELRHPAGRAALLDALADPVPAVRRGALEALKELPAEPQTVRACAERLVDADPAVRAAAIATLARLDPHAGTTLRTVLGDAHTSVRHQAAAVADVLHARAVRLLLADRDAEVRVAVLEALTRHPRPELTPTLLPMLTDSSWHVRRAAADAIGASGCKEDARPLVRALVDSHPIVRGRALIALERLLGDELDRVLTGALEEPAPPVRRAIVETLGRRGYIEPLPRLVVDEDAGVRIAVIHALEHASSPHARTAIERLADDPDIAVRNAAAVVIGGRRER